MKKFIIHSLTLLSALLILLGCVKERGGDPLERMNETIIALRVPIASQPTATRSIVEHSIADNYIKDVDILLFDASDNYVAHYYATNIVTDPVDPRLKKVKTRLPVGTYRAVILANSHEMVIGQVISGKPKRDAVLALYTSSLEYGTKYASDGTSATYKGFPMWGDLGNISITAGEETFPGKLYRMMSKINLEVAYAETAGVKNFELENIHIYNYNKTGYLAPKDGNWPELPAKKVATEYSSRQGSVPTLTSLHYDANYITTNAVDKTFGCKDEIFVFESAAFNGTWSWDKNTCVVFGGKYMGQTGYYRLDFSLDGTTVLDLLRNHSYTIRVKEIKTFGYITPEEALKNKSENIDYEVIPWDDTEIGEIIVDGPTQLIISPSSKLTFDKLEGLQKIEIYTNYEKGWQIDKLPGDITKSRIVDDAGVFVNWVTIDHEGTSIAEKKELQITVSENTANLTRKAYIYLTCSKIKHKLEVTQTDKVNVTFKVEFYDAASSQWVLTRNYQFIQDVASEIADPVDLRITWQPYNLPIRISMGAVGTNTQISWDGELKPDSKGTLITSATGQETFTLQPNIMTGYVKGSFTEHLQAVTYSIFVGGKPYTETVSFQHFVRDIVIEHLPVYLMNGKQQHITIKANTPWELYANVNMSSDIGAKDVKVVGAMGTVPNLDKMNNAPTDKSVNVYSGAYNMPSGTHVPVTTVNDITPKPTIYTGSLGLYAESTGSDLLNDAKTILCASAIPQDGREANCYVLNPEGGVGLLIPVRAANGNMTDKYKTSGGTALSDGGVPISIPPITSINPTYGAKLVWADVAGTGNKGLADDGLLSMVIPAGEGDDGYILVMPGNAAKEGNAVVAATRSVGGLGVILWSWHIWVTKDMKFEGGNIMQSRVMAGLDGAGKSTDYWLDRNLGATNNTPGTVGSLGNHYQWGRKDPFPGANKTEVTAAGNTNERQLYNATGPIGMNGVHGSVNNSAAGATVALSIESPLTFYSIGLSAHTLWGTTHGGISGTNSTTESGTDNGKSIYDPCPAGYRVPVRTSDIWTAATNTKHWGSDISNNAGIWTQQWWDATSLGINWGSTLYKGGWYPAAGVRASGLSTVGSTGLYWSGSSYDANGRSLHFTTGYIYPSNVTDSRNLGASVRCVAH